MPAACASDRVSSGEPPSQVMVALAGTSMVVGLDRLRPLRGA